MVKDIPSQAGHRLRYLKTLYHLYYFLFEQPYYWIFFTSYEKNPKSLTLLKDFRKLVILFTKIESPKMKSILSNKTIWEKVTFT